MATTAPQQTSSLFNLPGEIRNRIYRLVLVHQPDCNILPLSGKRSSAPLLHTCQQIRSEARSIYYGENNFHVLTSPYAADRFLRWLHAIGREQAALISALHVRLILSEPACQLSRARGAVSRTGDPAAELAEFDRRAVDGFARELAAVVLFRGLKAGAVVADDARSSRPPRTVSSVFIVRAAEVFQRRIQEG